MWHIGQKVVCINANKQVLKSLIKDDIYTIEGFTNNAFDGNNHGLFGLHLKELKLYNDLNVRWSFNPKRFVPLDILNNDSILEELLETSLIK